MNKIGTAKRLAICLLLAALLMAVTGCTTSRYERAGKLMTNNKYAEAALIYSNLSEHKDAAEMFLYASAADAGEKGDFATCLNGFTNLGTFRDSQLRLKYYTARQHETQAIAALDIEDILTYSHLSVEALKIYHTLSPYLDTGARSAATIQSMYDLSAALAAKEDYAGAAGIMDALLDQLLQMNNVWETYTDVPLWLDYYTACHYEAVGKYSFAANIFATLDNFNDSKQRCEALQKTVYQKAEAILSSGDSISAWNHFASLLEYRDSFDKAKDLLYRNSVTLLAGHDYAGARLVMSSLRAYGYSSAHIQECWYLAGETLLNAITPDYDAAKVAFTEAGSYLNAEELATYGCGYQKAKALIAAGNLADAYYELQPLKGYNDVDELLQSEEFVAAILQDIRIANYSSEGFVTFLAGNGKYGYVNINTGEMIEPQWDSAYDFSNGMALVKRFSTESGMTEAYDLYGFIDYSGAMVLESQWTEVDSFTCGLARIMQDGKYGYIDKAGKMVIKPQWDNAEPFFDGLAIVEKDHVCGCIDTQGEVVGWLVTRELHTFSEDMARCSEWHNSEYVDGYIDQTGKSIFDSQWSAVGDFSEGRAVVMLNDDYFFDKYGYIDKTGTMVIEPRWDYAWDFSDGFAKVALDNKFYFIDQSGAVVLEPHWDIIHSFSEGLAPIKTNGKWGYVDKNGTIVIQPQWDEVSGFSGGRAQVKLDGKWGYIDQNGTIIASPQWDDAKYFSGDLAQVELDGKIGLVNKFGKVVLGLGVVPDFPLVQEDTQSNTASLITTDTMASNESEDGISNTPSSPVTNITPQPTIAIEDIQYGSYITFGHYPQTIEGNDATPIEWLVLDYDEEAQEALVISKYALDAQPYHREHTYPTWEKSDIRRWLNNEFLNTAFTKNEQAAIITTEIFTPDYYGIDGGENTLDRIFLLSLDEAAQYFENATVRQASPTKYAIIIGAQYYIYYPVDDVQRCWWRLRSPGRSNGTASYVLGGGEFNYINVESRVPIRPAFKLNLKGL